MPTPKEGESKDDFMSRCMGDDKMVDEFGNPQQRAAVCSSYFEDKDKTATEEYEDWGAEDVTAAEYQGRKVTLNKPFRTPKGPKKFAVYTKNEKGTVVIVRFGDPNMEIKRDDPKRRKAFRDRHNCSSPGPKWKARYWSCYQWRSGSKVEASDPKTPAPPKDRIKGSPKNKKDSAKDSKGKITFTEAIENSLKKKVKEHNEKSERKVTVGMLKAVYRRGAGAYSQSHRPGVSRGAWAMARVNAFLKLVRSGKPSNPKYTTDNDLLPKGHPRKSKKAEADCGCGDCGCNDEPVKAAEPTPKSDETHDEYMSRCEAAGYTTEECMAAHEGHKFRVEGYKDKDDDYKSDYERGESCPPGQEMRDGECRRVAVTLDIDIQEVETSIIASTGETVVRITGIAFHEGVNKNSWGIRPELAARLADEMVGADVTLNHPKAKGGRFTRNMDGGVDEAVVGNVTEGSYHSRENGYLVKYVAEIRRPELFQALESGLWMKPEYGVSIGGTGIPTEVIEADEEGGRPTMWFADDFKFDHLAIVHRPAYPEANIETVERVEKSASDLESESISSEELPVTDEYIIYQSTSSPDCQEAKYMSDEIIEENLALETELESIKAELVLREARIAEFEAAEAARVEEYRASLVTKASDIGLKGHDDFTTETLESLIASWESSRPVVEEPTVEMTPAEPASSEPVKADEDVSYVANYLNGEVVKSEETLYARAYNSWANAWNSVMGATEAPALRYEEINN